MLDTFFICLIKVYSEVKRRAHKSILKIYKKYEAQFNFQIQLLSILLAFLKH